MRKCKTKRSRAGLVALVATFALVCIGCDPGLTSVVAGGDSTFVAVGDVLAIPGGGFYIVDTGACEIDRIDTTGAKTVVAGTGTCGFSGDGGPATSAKIDPEQSEFRAATGQLALDSSGTLYFTDSGNARVRKVTTDGTITTIAGNGTGGNIGSYLSDTCAGVVAFAGGITVTPDDTVYVACPAGIGRVNGDGTLTRVAITYPSALTSDVAGNLYYGSYGFGGVAKLDLSTGITSAVNDLQSLPVNDQSPDRIVTDLTFGPDSVLYASLGSIRYYSSCGGYCIVSKDENAGLVVRIDAVGLMRIAGTGIPDPATGPQSGHGRDLSLSPSGITIAADGRLLVGSSKTVYAIVDPAIADSGNGSNCTPNLDADTDFTGLDLHGFDFNRCDLTGVAFTNANLTGVNFTNSILTDTDLTGANLSSTDLTSATGTPVGADSATYANTICPDGVSVSGPATCVGHGF